jgi:ankyrin repeat domain-containing protein 50
VLAKSLIDIDFKDSKLGARSTCYFFFKDDNDSQRSIAGALSALLHQLFSVKPALVQYALPDYTAEGSRLPQLFHKLWAILIKASADPKAGEIICVLDALDECEESNQVILIQALKDFYSNASTAHTQSRLKFLVTSRPYMSIERNFAELTHHFPSIRLQGEKELETIGQEIEMVICSTVFKLALELQLDDSEQSILQTELLGTNIQRTYLWLNLIVQVIRETSSPTIRKLKSTIRELPRTIDQAYEAILSKIKDQKQAQKLFHIILAATRPLTLTELNIFLSIKDEHRSLTDIELENEARFATSIKNICGLFISVIDQKVYLIHQTAKEFLVTRNSSLCDGWKHSLQPIESNLVLARICITYLMFTDFNDDRVDDSSISLATESSSLFPYAAKFWTIHYRQAQQTASDELLRSVVSLFEPQSARRCNWFKKYSESTNVLSQAPHHDDATIILASHFGLEAVVELLLDMGADVHSKDKDGRTPLLWAAENGHEAIVKLLLSATAEIDSKDTLHHRSPLSGAAKNGHWIVVKRLLDNGAEVDSRDEKDQTPLSWASYRGHEVVVKLLLDAGAEVDSMDINGQTALSLASKNGHEIVAKWLLGAGAEIDSKDKMRRTALSLASENGHEIVAKLLLGAGAKIDSKDSNGRTALLWASESGHEAVVKLLLDAGAAIGSTESIYDQTSLGFAALNGQEAVVELLLNSEAETDRRDGKRGQTPLSWASESGHENIVHLLLNFGATVDSYDESGRTPLSWAAENGNRGVVKTLLDAGADVNSSDYEGRTSLSWACENGFEGVVMLILESGIAVVNSWDNQGRTPLFLAIESENWELVSLLMEAGPEAD